MQTCLLVLLSVLCVIDYGSVSLTSDLVSPVNVPLRKSLAGSLVRREAWPVAQAPGALNRHWPRWPGCWEGRRHMG